MVPVLEIRAMAMTVHTYCSRVLPVESESGASMGDAAPPVAYKKFICSFPDCNAAYNKTWKLLAHLCKHTGEKPFPCTYEGCSKGFTSSFHLNRHILTHTGEKPFNILSFRCQSEHCNLAFTTAYNMRLHFKRVHDSPAPIYVCNFPDCGKEFRKHNQLRVHQCTHTNENPYKCTHEGCDKGYGTPARLKRHEKTHAGYPCRKDSTCQFVGKTWTEYLKHVAADHPDVTCSICNRMFKKKQNLKDHKKTHTEHRIVYCCPRENCDRTYTKKCNLTFHISSFHEDLKPFVCEYEGCGKTFAIKQSLDRHFNTHDPEKKKMVKVRPPRPGRGLASRLSGYKPKKSPKGEQSPSETPAPESSQQPPNGSQQEPLLVMENLTLK